MCVIAWLRQLRSSNRLVAKLVPWHSETGKVMDGTHSTLKHQANIFGKNDIRPSVRLALHFCRILSVTLAAFGVGLVLVAGD
jgi:hypothetical protein